MNVLSNSGQLLTNLYVVNNFISKKVDNKLSIHGINFSEFLVMLHLYKNKQVRRSDLAEKIGLTASGITRMLGPMERIGLVQRERNPRDARVSLVKLTESGERILNDSMVSIDEISNYIFSGFSTKDKENMDAEIQKISRA